MRHAIGLLLILALATAPAVAAPGFQDEATQDEKPAAPTPSEQVQKLKDEYAEAREAFMAAYREAPKEERRAVIDKLYPDAKEYGARFLALARAHPGTDAAGESYLWVLANHREKGAQEEVIRALRKDHLDRADLGRYLGALVYSQAEGGDELLEALVRKSPHEDVRGQALYYLAKKVMRSGQESPKKVEELLVRVKEEFGEVAFRRGNLADAAEGDLFEVRHLQIGQVAPDIVGQDLNGVEFKLSDYRGKVVFLDFWGNW